MGMDLLGKAPIDDEGNYFRASIWEWRAIHELMHTLCRDLLDGELLSAMQWNEGAGPDDDATCLQMAARFHAWLADFQGEEYYLKNGVMDNAPETAVLGMLAQCPDLEVVTGSKNGYAVERETLVAFIRFLESCRGFEVW